MLEPRVLDEMDRVKYKLQALLKYYIRDNNRLV